MARPVKRRGARADVPRVSLSTFVCRDEEERAWLLDMHDRLQPVERASVLLVAVALICCIPWFPPLAIVPMVLAGAVFFAGSAAVKRTRSLTPLVVGWFCSTGLIMAAVVIYAREHPFDGAGVAIGSMLLIWPLLGACGGLPTRVVVVCAAWCCALVVVPSLALFGPEVRASPPLVVVPVAMLAATATISSAVRRASMEHRTAAVIDQLTGMLNRAALETRANELRHQSELTGEHVGVIMADLDHFKRINDTHGHAVGDHVLTEVAYRMRKQLRAFDLAYRIGGEEFVVLLPGASAVHAREIAEALRTAVRSEPIGGVGVTVSLGVAISGAGPQFDLDDTLRCADAALYQAKAAGRDRVVVAHAGPVGLRRTA